MLAVLLCFHYIDDKKLPGFYHDLCTAYRFLMNKGYYIIVITDDDNYLATDWSKITGGDISFLSTLSKCKHYNVKSLYDLKLVLSRLPPDERIFFYFSGHGINGGFLCPDDRIIKQEKLLKYLNYYNNSVIVLDCCYALTLNLPYTFEKNTYSNRSLMTSLSTKNNILLLTSSTETEKTSSGLRGSLFTGMIFKLMSDGIISLGAIWKKITDSIDTNCYIYSSNKSIKQLPVWLFYPYDVKVVNDNRIWYKLKLWDN